MSKSDILRSSAIKGRALSYKYTYSCALYRKLFISLLGVGISLLFV